MKEVTVTYVTSGEKLEVPIEFVLIPAPSGFRYRLTPQFTDENGAVYGYDGPNNVGNVRPFYLSKYLHCDANRFPIFNVDMHQATQIASSIGGRLPTEYEWEWAAYGGEDWEFAGCTDASKVAWADQNKVQKVGQLKPNGYGLYDMSGLMWEGTSTVINNESTIKNDGFYRTRRGGSWYDVASDVRVAKRAALIQCKSYVELGFRIAMDVESINEAIQSGRAKVIR